MLLIKGGTWMWSEIKLRQPIKKHMSFALDNDYIYIYMIPLAKLELPEELSKLNRSHTSCYKREPILDLVRQCTVLRTKEEFI